MQKHNVYTKNLFSIYMYLNLNITNNFNNEALIKIYNHDFYLNFSFKLFELLIKLNFNSQICFIILL